MATVSAEAEKQHPQVMTVREGGDAVSVPETDRVGSDGRKRLESESEVDDRASDVGSDIGPERRCTSASGAGESEYESVDEGDESPKEAAPSASPKETVASSPASANMSTDHSATSINSKTQQKGAQEPICVKSDERITKNCTTLRSMCWADVSEATDSLDALEDSMLEESALPLRDVIENELEHVEKNSSSAETKHEALGVPLPEEEDDDEDENYEDIESDASERQSSREEVVESEEEGEIVPDGEGKRDAGKEDGDEEDGDDTSSDQPAKPLDDDEDMRKPQYIPKRGAFYEHDDRLGSDEEGKVPGDRESVASDTSQPKSAKHLTISNKKSNPVRTLKDHPDPKLVKVDAERWGHDMFREDEQKPKSREELLTSYGYDIRSQEGGHQKTVRYNKRGATHIRSNKSWKDESDRSPHTRKETDDQAAAKTAPNPGVPSAASKANEKIAMREAHQENERRRYERESKPPQRESLQRDRAGHRQQELGNRRPSERSDRRQNEDMSSRNTASRKPFSRDDFPELISHRPAEHSQKKPRDEPGPWNRNTASNNHSSARRRDQSSDESQERPVVRTQVVYSSSRFTKDSRSPKSDTHHSYNPPTNGSHRSKFDRPDRNERHEHRENRQPATYRKTVPPRQNDSANRFNDQELRNDRSQRNNRRDYPSDRGPNRQVPRKDNDEAVQRTTDLTNDIAVGMQKVSVDQRNNQRRPPVADGQAAESESRPKRYSATRSQQQLQPPPSQSQSSVPCTEPASHHPAVAHQPMPQQVNPPPHQYYDPGPHSPPEYYPEAEGPAYAAYPADPSGFMAHAHHSRYIPSHPVTPASNPLNPPPAPLAVMPGTAAAFLPTFTPSLPPSGFPQYPPPQQYHHAMGPPVPGPACPPPTGSEMFRGGVTYYDTTQQQPIRSLPPKRPKNILPILPPPDIDGHQQDLTHMDNANPGY